MPKVTKTILRLILTLAATAVGLWLVASGWGGRIDPRTWALPAVLGLTYPIALTATLLLLLVALLARSWKVAIGLVAAMVVTLPALRVTVPLNGSHQAADSARTFTLLTYNVMGFDNYAQQEDTSSTMRYILDTNADLVVLQEASMGSVDFTVLPSTLPLRDELQRKYPYHARGYHDLLILSRYPYTVMENNTLRNMLRPREDIKSFHFYAKAFNIFMPTGESLRIINVHLQSIGLSPSDKQAYRNITNLDSVQNHNNMDRMRHSLYIKLAEAFRRRANEAQKLRRIVDKSGKNVIVCGDFNDTPASYTYWTLRGNDMEDAFAQCGSGYTHTFNSDLMLFNIDHVLYRGNFEAIDIRRDKAGSSDHYPQLVTFRWK